MRLIFFGSGEFGLPTLEALMQRHAVSMVVTQPDRPAGRNRELTPTPIADQAVLLGIPVIKPEKVNDEAIVRQIRDAKADAWVVIAFGQKLGKTLLEGVFAINLHASLLPKYRGAAPINWAMIEGESETGVSVITLADRMDAGWILVQRSTSIDPGETAGELHDRLGALGPQAVLSALDKYRCGALHPIAQDESLVTQAPKFTKSDGTVCFDQPAVRVRQRVHGLTPWPGCTVTLDGQPLRLLRVEVADESSRHLEVGVVLPDFSIACQSGRVRILEVQRPGGKPMTFEAYRHGHGVRAGARCLPA
jgi:methionyl-tRNA formyltransferase